MTLIKIVTAANWVVIGLLAILLIVGLFNPSSGGGDAATAGLGKALFMIGIFSFIILLVLNLLPYDWSKYTALGLVVAPLLFITSAFTFTRWKQEAAERKRNEQPYFDDQERNQIAEALFEANPEKIKKYVAQYGSLLQDPSQGYPVMQLAVDCITRYGDQQQNRYECLQILLDARIATQFTDSENSTQHVGYIALGNPKLLEFLLKNGFNPNAKSNDFQMGQQNIPILFAAINVNYSAQENLKLLLQYGVDPNSPYTLADRPTTALMFAAKNNRWDLCLLLLENGADPLYLSPDGNNLEKIIKTNQGFNPDTYSTQEDYQKLKNQLGKYSIK
jgi:Ankyrin repeats (3 copies)